jgi:hypothetical protein
MKTLDNAFDIMVSKAWGGLKLVAGGFLFIGVLLQIMQEYIF